MADDKEETDKNAYKILSKYEQNFCYERGSLELQLKLCYPQKKDI